MPASSFASALSGCGIVATTVTESSTSVTYNAVTEQLEIVSNDAALAGTSETIQVNSYLVDWPTITGATVTVTVSYVLNPCVDILQNSILVPTDESETYIIGDPVEVIVLPSDFSSALAWCGTVTTTVTGETS